jgi:hypothetical protein
MDTFYKAQLPRGVATLVERIESFAKREISVEVDNRPRSPTSPNPDSLAARVTPTSAMIVLRSKDVFPPHDVLHELLHIERMWVEGIPQLVPKHDPKGTRSKIANDIENALEHLVIVPREANYGFDPYPYWNETSRRNWVSYPWPALTDPWARRKACLLGWLTVSCLVNDEEVRSHVEKCLRQEEEGGPVRLDEAKRFSARISEKLVSKPQAQSAVLRFLEIPTTDFMSVRFNVNDGTIEELRLPPN